jgi:hypothetical protein
VRPLTVALLAAALLTLGATGCGGSDDGGGAELPRREMLTVRPPSPQLLAFAAGSRIGVVEGERVRYVGELGDGRSLLGEIGWSGDGRHVAWVTTTDDYDNELVMVDVRDGSKQTWSDVTGTIEPGMHGVVLGRYDGEFVEYLPDGSSERFEVDLPLPREPEGIPPTHPDTGVNAVRPFEGAWLVFAEHNAIAGRGGPVRAFRYDPQRRSRQLVARGTGLVGAPVPMGDGRAVWIERRSGSACISVDELGAIGVRIANLPARDDERTWGIGRLAVADGIHVLARGTGQFPTGGADCDSDLDYRWLTLRDGAWAEREGGLFDLDLAADGRVARVRGRYCLEDEACPEVGYSRAELEGASLELPGGEEIELPDDTTQVRFSPALPSRVLRAGGDGPALDDRMVVGFTGLGPLAFGASPVDLQASTSTPLSFELDRGGCGTVTPTDLGLEQELGFEGQLADGRLDALVVSSLDVPAEDGDDEDVEPDELSDLQPGVGAVEPRGPRTDRGLRAGETVDMLYELYGEPTRRGRPTRTGAVEYTYELAEGVLVARADGAGTIRRLELRASEPADC